MIYNLFLALSLKVHRQISKKRCFEKYFSFDKACHFQLYGRHPDGVIWKKLIIDDKYINKGA